MSQERARALTAIVLLLMCVALFLSDDRTDDTANASALASLVADDREDEIADSRGMTKDAGTDVDGKRTPQSSSTSTPLRIAHVNQSAATVPSSRTAFCFSGSLIGHVGHTTLRGATACVTSQRRLLQSLDPSGAIFAVVNPCAPQSDCEWRGDITRCLTRNSSLCENVTGWSQSLVGDALSSSKLVLERYTDSDSAPPPSGCATDQWPPAESRSYRQFWGWRRCLELIEADESRQQRRFGAIVHLRPDMCMPGAIAPFHTVPAISTLLARTAPDAVLVTHGKGKRGSEQWRLACSDTFGIVRRQHAGVYFATVDQYHRCANATAWHPYYGQHYAGFFAQRIVLGEIALRKQLQEHRLRCLVPGQS